MDDVKAELKSRIDRSGRKLKKIAREAGVNYTKLRNWYCGRTLVLDANDAERVSRNLNGGGE